MWTIPPSHLKGSSPLAVPLGSYVTIWYNKSSSGPVRYTGSFVKYEQPLVHLANVVERDGEYRTFSEHQIIGVRIESLPSPIVIDLTDIEIALKTMLILISSNSMSPEAAYTHIMKHYDI